MLAGKRVMMIAAMATNRVIGRGNDIPWKIPGEQRRFRELTLDRLVVMGRKTFESIGKPLPRRDLLVLSSRPDAVSGARVAESFDDAVAMIRDDRRTDVVIGGGQRIYTMFLPYADLVYLTEIDLYPSGDAFFPELPERFALVDSIAVPGDVNYAFNTYANVELERSDTAGMPVSTGGR